MPASEFETDFSEAGRFRKSAFGVKADGAGVLTADAREDRVNTLRSGMVLDGSHQPGSDTTSTCPGFDHDRTFHGVRIPRSGSELAVGRESEKASPAACDQEWMAIEGLVLQELRQAIRSSRFARERDHGRTDDLVPQPAHGHAVGHGCRAEFGIVGHRGC